MLGPVKGKTAEQFDTRATHLLSPARGPNSDAGIDEPRVRTDDRLANRAAGDAGLVRDRFRSMVIEAMRAQSAANWQLSGFTGAGSFLRTTRQGLETGTKKMVCLAMWDVNGAVLFAVLPSSCASNCSGVVDDCTV